MSGRAFPAIVLTDAAEKPAERMAKCPKHRDAAVVPSGGFGEPHGVCSECGYEPLELPK